MPIPPEIESLIDRLNLELEEIEGQAMEALNLIRPILSSFPDNVILTQLFASLNNFLLFVEISKRRINITVNRLSSNDVTTAEILEAGEDLGAELGRALEAKISVIRIIARLQELR
jgi:hypothetical protein